jgi:hypothetical protein
VLQWMRQRENGKPGSEQFQFEPGLFSISLISTIPGVAGGGPGEPDMSGGTGWAQP